MVASPDSVASRLISDLGRRVAEIRQKRGWTQQELADELDVTLRYVQAVEGGKQNLSLRSVAAFSVALGVPPIDLLQAPHTVRRRPGRPRRT